MFMTQKHEENAKNRNDYLRLAARLSASLNSCARSLRKSRYINKTYTFTVSELVLKISYGIM